MNITIFLTSWNINSLLGENNVSTLPMEPSAFATLDDARNYLEGIFKDFKVAIETEKDTNTSCYYLSATFEEDGVSKYIDAHITITTL